MASATPPPWDPSNPLIKLDFSSFTARKPDGTTWYAPKTAYTELRLAELLATSKFTIGLISAAGDRIDVDFALQGHRLLLRSVANAQSRLTRQANGSSLIAWDSYSGHVPFSRPLQDDIFLEGSFGLGYAMAQVTQTALADSQDSPLVRLSISNLNVSPYLVTVANPDPDKSGGTVSLTNAVLPPFEIPKNIYDQADWQHTIYAQPDANADGVTYQIKNPLNIKLLFPPPPSQSRRGLDFHVNVHDVATIAQSVAIIVAAVAFNSANGSPIFSSLPDQVDIPFHVSIAITGHATISG